MYILVACRTQDGLKAEASMFAKLAGVLVLKSQECQFLHILAAGHAELLL